MSVLEFRPRWWQIAVSWLLFAVCLVLAAWLGRMGHRVAASEYGHVASREDPLVTLEPVADGNYQVPVAITDDSASTDPVPIWPPGVGS